MSTVREAIEEMIEESYLAGLSAEEIRRDFSRFIDTCRAVVHGHVRDRATATGLVEGLAREKASMLLAGRPRATRTGGAVPGPRATGSEPAEGFAEEAARRKRLVLRTIGEFDPRLVELIEERRFGGGVDASRPRARRWADRRQSWRRYQLPLLRLGYVAAVLLIILLVYLGHGQRP